MSEDKTEQASARRLEKAREEGDVPVSRDLVLLASLAGGTAAIASSGNGAVAWFGAALRRPQVADGTAIVLAAHDVLGAVLPVAAASCACAVAATLLQTGFLIRTAALMPDLSRIGPARGLGRMVSTETLLHTGQAAAKIAILAGALWIALGSIFHDLLDSPWWGPALLRARLVAASWHLVLLLGGAQIGFTLLDVFLVRFRHAQKLRMTKQEQKDEHKEAEGNPHVKQRLRSLARSRGRRRMMQAVRRATVVVTNPTHYAVALAYERGSRGAPRVVAKGVDELAARIREEAREHRIPAVANPPLARALYRIELDTEIPAEHFKAVAEIVAYVWRLGAASGRL